MEATLSRVKRKIEPDFRTGAGQKSSFDYLRKEEPYFLFA
jgi:hypothetical protein